MVLATSYCLFFLLLLFPFKTLSCEIVTTSLVDYQVSVVPPELNLHPFYEKYINADGIPVVSSSQVRDNALLKASEVITLMLSKRPDLKQKIVEKYCKVMIIGQNEGVCDLPEYAHICNTEENIYYWNNRARGFGGAPEDDFSASFGEENILCLEGDRYKGESILVHEFAHLIHLVGIKEIEPEFDIKLEKIRNEAIRKGLWANTYAITNKEEYFAESVQSFLIAIDILLNQMEFIMRLILVRN